MVQTNKIEKEERAGVTYWDAFRGTNLRRTEIACMCFLSQITDGGALCYSGTFFFQQTGISAETSYAIGLGGTGVAFIGTIVSWFYISKFGRRDIWLWGFYVLVVVLFLIGILACLPQNLSLAWAQSSLTLVWLGAYSMSVGPIVYTIVAEIGSTRLRTQTVVLGRATYYVGNIIGGVLQPHFMSPTSWNAQGKTVSGTQSCPHCTRGTSTNLLIVGFLLGLPVILNHCLGFLPPPRDQGPHILRA